MTHSNTIPLANTLALWDRVTERTVGQRRKREPTKRVREVLHRPLDPLMLSYHRFLLLELRHVGTSLDPVRSAVGLCRTYVPYAQSVSGGSSRVARGQPRRPCPSFPSFLL